MHDIKDIRNNFDFFLKKISERNIKINLEPLLELDKKNRNLIQTKEKLEQEKKKITKTKDQTLFSKSKDITKQIDDLDLKIINIKNDMINCQLNVLNQLYYSLKGKKTYLCNGNQAIETLKVIDKII